MTNAASNHRVHSENNAQATRTPQPLSQMNALRSSLGFLDFSLPLAVTFYCVEPPPDPVQQTSRPDFPPQLISCHLTWGSSTTTETLLYTPLTSSKTILPHLSLPCHLSPTAFLCFLVAHATGQKAASFNLFSTSNSETPHGTETSAFQSNAYAPSAGREHTHHPQRITAGTKKNCTRAQGKKGQNV